MLNQLLTAPGIKRVIDQIPTELLRPFGGVWDERVPSVNADDDELTMFAQDVPVAADLLAPSATSRDVDDGPAILRLDRAFRLKQSAKLTHTDIKYLLKLGDAVRTMGRLSRDDSGGLANWLQRRKSARLAGVAIRRGILKAGMAQGDFAYDQGGYKLASIDFGMDASMKATPGVYWLSGAGTLNANATPVTDIGLLQTTANNLEGMRFNALDLPRATYNAMVQTTEFQNTAKAVTAFSLTTSLPNVNDERLMALAGQVLSVNGQPIKITIDDQTYHIQNTDGTRTTTGRYLNLNYAVLSNTEDWGRATRWDWANVPVTETVIANAIGDGGVFGGADRGPIGYFTGDRNEYSWMRSHATQEGTPRRWMRTVTARITARGG